jgi:hypothetical protein
MTLQRPWSRPAFETPIERIFRKIMRRQMTKEERRWFRLKRNPTPDGRMPIVDS